MKISTLITILLMVGVFIFVVVSMLIETEDNYDVEINKSAWQDQYDFANDVNESIYPIKESIDGITDEESGWLERVGSGFTGIVAAVTFLPTMVWDLGRMGGNLVSGIGTVLHLPSYMIFVFVLMLLVWGVIKLIEFFQRWNV